MLYPLVFQPIFKERPWGGRELAALYQKPLPPDVRIGESWEISDRPGDASVIANGPLAGKDLRWLMEHHAADLLGAAPPVNGRFPLLVKLLDAREVLSVQVHPPARVAERLGGEPKTELWYVAQAQPGARLFAGLRRGATRSQMIRKAGEGTLEDCLHSIPVQAGSAVFVPSGRLHALGAGVVIFEIQQNSDTTYRVFDWNRTDERGQPRELHFDKALECIDFDDIEPGLVESRVEQRGTARLRSLAENPLFEVAEVQAPAGFSDEISPADYPRIVAVVGGKVTLNDPASGVDTVLTPGTVALLPACLGAVSLTVNEETTFLFAAAGYERVADARPLTEAEEAAAPAPAWKYYARHRRRTPSERLPGQLPSSHQVKKELARKFRYMPFLKLLVLSFWFRLVVLGFVGLVVFFSLFLPKIWRTTPRDFAPEVKISGLDKVQSLMLQRTARRAQAARQYDRALYAWGSAIANDMADLRAVRGFLGCIAEQEPPPRQRITAAAQYSFWLLRLGGTNVADLELTTRVFEGYQLHDLVTQVLEPFKETLTADLAPRYAKALFFSGKFDEFGRRWPLLSAEARSRPDLALIHDAYELGWRQPANAAEIRRRLEQLGQGVGPLHDMANRLLLQVANHLSDPDGYSRVLGQLQRDQADTGVDHATYWRLLRSVGRLEEARFLAELYTIPPRSARELVVLAGTHDLLGLSAKALGLFQQHAVEFGYAAEVWLAYAEIVNREGNWDELNAVTVRMRENLRLREEQEGFIDYLEGWSFLKRGVTNQAEALFIRASTKSFGYDWQAIAAALNMAKAGFPNEAREVLAKVTPSESLRNAYWEASFETAWALKDEGLMLVTVEAAFAANPQQAVWAGRRTATLLVTRQQPEEAIRLSMLLRAQFPDSLGVQINHAFALIYNRRLEEAGELLASLADRPMSPDEAHSYALARFELLLLRDRPDLARVVLRQVDRSRLFPTQARWLQEQMKKIEPVKG
ncbi:MAG: class I mannose-6-phosphate isomerase [Verrucomicrobia bacterium]|nr:class I mannose-6-phosphate isomerase [Verrucomicrobiota bacterium]